MSQIKRKLTTVVYDKAGAINQMLKEPKKVKLVIFNFPWKVDVAIGLLKDIKPA